MSKSKDDCGINFLIGDKVKWRIGENFWGKGQLITFDEITAVIAINSGNVVFRDTGILEFDDGVYE